jgi:hypothetical protein
MVAYQLNAYLRSVYHPDHQETLLRGVFPQEFRKKRFSMAVAYSSLDDNYNIIVIPCNGQFAHGAFVLSSAWWL